MATTTVSPGQSIQSAIDAASPGDTILVKAGTYAAGLVVSEANITLRSEAKWGAVLDGQHSDANGIQAKSGASGLVVDGFKICKLRSQGSSCNGVELYSAGQGAKVLFNWFDDIGRSNFTGSNGQTGVTVRQNDVEIAGNYFSEIGRTTPGDVSRDHGIYANGGGGCSGLKIIANYFEEIEHGWAIQLYPGSWDNFKVNDNQFVGGNPDRDGTHIVLGAELVGEMLRNVFWAPGASETLHDYSGPWGISFAGNVTTGSKWTDGGTAGLNMGAGNTLNAQIPKPPPPTAGGSPPPPPPPPPGHATPDLKVGIVTNTSVTLTWAPLAGVTGYDLTRDGVFVAHAGPAAKSAKFGKLPPTPVELGVKAIYADGFTFSSKTTFRVVG